MVLAGAEHRDDVAGAVGGGEGREGRADEEKEGGEDPARVGGGAPASDHSGGPVVAGAGSGQSRLETDTNGDGLASDLADTSWALKVVALSVWASKFSAQLIIDKGTLSKEKIL